MAAPGEKKYIACVFFSCLGIFIGLSVFFVFGFNFRNWNASLWGFTSAVPALITLFVHIGNKKRRWENCSERLRSYMLAGCFFQLAGVCGFVCYLTLAITAKQGVNHQLFSNNLYGDRVGYVTSLLSVYSRFNYSWKWFLLDMCVVLYGVEMGVSAVLFFQNLLAGTSVYVFSFTTGNNKRSKGVRKHWMI